MARITRMVIYDSVLFNRTGHVRRWADGVERKFTLNAIAAAPFNKRINKSHRDRRPPGALKASIHGDVDRIGPVHLQIVCSADVPYATFVLRGTRPIITPRNGPFLRLPVNPGFTRTQHKSVRGQHAQNFFAEAALATERTHRSLRGFGAQLFRTS